MEEKKKKNLQSKFYKAGNLMSPSPSGFISFHNPADEILAVDGIALFDPEIADFARVWRADDHFLRSVENFSLPSADVLSVDG